MRHTRNDAVNSKDDMTPAQRELWDKVERVRPAMLTTVDEDGSLRSRPMWTLGDDFDGSLWFFTADDAPKAAELERNPQVGLSYAAPDKDLYVSVSGRATLVHDKARIGKLWNIFAEAWFPTARMIRTSPSCESTSTTPSTGKTRSPRCSSWQRS